jgi:hypothetical protein
LLGFLFLFYLSFSYPSYIMGDQYLWHCGEWKNQAYASTVYAVVRWYLRADEVPRSLPASPGWRCCGCRGVGIGAARCGEGWVSQTLASAAGK